MSYKAKFFTHSDALGDKILADVLCSFTINGAGSRNMRVEVRATGTPANFKLQTSMDGTNWVDATDTPVGITGGAEIVITQGDAQTPLRPLGRLIATGAITAVSSVAVAMDW